MKITKEEKNRILKLHESYRNCKGSLIKEHALGGMASVGSGFVNPQGSTGTLSKFLQRQQELDECGEGGGPMEDNVMQSYDQRYDPPMEENLAGFYEVPIEIEMTEKSEVVYDDENFVVIEKDKDTKEDSDEEEDSDEDDE